MSTREKASKTASEWRENGVRVGLASGAFDLLHVGHVDYLTGLRAKVDWLVVAVMSDARCRTKGEDRPIIPEAHRLAMVSALACVDDAFIFDEHGDEKNIAMIRPNVFGRGDGHTADMFEKGALVKYGVEVALIHVPRVESTTAIIARIRK